MKKTLLASLVASLCLSASLSAHAKNYELTFANFFGPDHPNSLMMEKFKEELESSSKGKFKVTLKENNEAGGEEEIMSLTKSGQIQMAQVGGLLKVDEPMIAAWEQPFVIESWDHAKKVFLSEGINKFKGQYTEKSGARIGGVIVNGFRQISTSFPVKNMDDLSKVKMRVPLNDVFVQLFKALGTTPTKMSAKELYTALESKVVDGQDNPYTMFESMGWYEVNPYVLESRHIFSPTFIIINEKWYQSMEEGDKKVFDEALAHAIDYNWEMSQDNEDETIANLQDRGVTITIPTSEFKENMVKAVSPVYEWFDKEIPGAKDFREYCQGLR